MKRFIPVLLFTFIIVSCYSQDFSNKGKDFWVGYGSHCQMYDNFGNDAPSGGTQEMVLYFTSDVNATVKITIPSTGWTRSYTLQANTVVESELIPKTGANDVRLRKEGKLKKSGIHITSDKPIVAYAHIYNGNISGATLLFPTNTLGREYYSLNFRQNSNQIYSYPFCFAIATEDSTIIEVTPSARTLTHAAGIKFRDTLMQGDIYNLLGAINENNGNFTGVDLTGTKINSVSNSTGGCKRIAVFSGSGKLNIKCKDDEQNSADNTIQQVLPANAWGKKYYTVPTANMPYNYFRILIKNPATVVKFNGTVLKNLTNNSFYDVPIMNTPSLIEADQPVLAAQYITTRNQCNNFFLGDEGDPEMIYLSPVEQTIDKITLNSTFHSAISQHWINVIIKSNAVASFRLDGASQRSSFKSHPLDAVYSYAQLKVSPGQHSLRADSGFNAIAYGYGFAESYGYNAGTNVKDLYQFISTINKYSIVPEPSACSKSSFFFAITLPYKPTSLYWNFKGHHPNVSQSNPSFDTTYFVNGRQVWRFRLTTPSTYVTGTYPVTVTANNPTAEGCSGVQDIDFDLNVYNPPVANFFIENNGCITDSAWFTDNSNLNGRPAYKWYWDFGDSKIGNTFNPSHKYTLPGNFKVRYQVITDVGCLSDTVTKPVILTDAPVARFSVSSPACAGDAITLFESNSSQAALVKAYWDYGDKVKDTLTPSSSHQHTYKATGIYTIKLKVETNSGCQSTDFVIPVAIHPFPEVDFSLPKVCLPSGIAQFNNLSKIEDGTESSFTYHWNFGDVPSNELNSSFDKNPVHYYNNPGPFNVNLAVISKDGCRVDSTKVLSDIYAAAKADFISNTETCFNDSTSFTDQSTGNGNAITNWYWDFGDGHTSTLKNPKHLYEKSGSYNVQLYIKTNKDCLSDTIVKRVVINPLPVASFNNSAIICESKPVTFSNTSAPNTGNIVLWKWSFGDGTNLDLNNSAAFTHVYTKTGTYNVSLSVETDKGCRSNTFTKSIIVSPLPVANFILPEVCLTDAFAEFIDSSYIKDNSERSFTYKWNFGDNLSGNTNTSILKDPRHKYNAVGAYSVSQMVTSQNGCSTEIVKPFIVNGSIPKADFNVQTTGNICGNTNVQIQNTSSVNFGSITKVEIYWDYINNPDAFDVDDDPITNKSYSHHYPNFQSPLTKTFNIKFRAFSGGSCVDEITKNVSLNATPLIRFNAIPDICYSAAPFLITQASETGGVPGSGAFTGIGTNGSGIFNSAAAGIGTHTIRYTFTSGIGCIEFKEQTIQVLTPPVVDAGPDRFVLEGGTIILEPNISGSNLNYLWTPNQYINSSTLKNPVVTGISDITYLLTVTAGGNCSAFDEVSVKVLKFPKIPNTFTPNNDGINDKWIIQYLETYSDNRVQVFNRYGQLVFESRGYRIPWDGNMNGKSLPFGTYYYIIEPGNGHKPVTGYVTIIK